MIVSTSLVRALESMHGRRAQGVLIIGEADQRTDDSSGLHYSSICLRPIRRVGWIVVQATVTRTVPTSAARVARAGVKKVGEPSCNELARQPTRAE